MNDIDVFGANEEMGGGYEMATVLLIDDDPLILETLRGVLKSAGHGVLTASNGNEGIELIEKIGVEVVVTDILMPESEGIETIMHIRRHNPSVMLIAMSGGGRTSRVDVLEIAKKLGATHTLAKPFSPKELLALISLPPGREIGSSSAVKVDGQ